jgi:hypothetical protein
MSTDMLSSDKPFQGELEMTVPLSGGRVGTLADSHRETTVLVKPQ